MTDSASAPLKEYLPLLIVICLGASLVPFMGSALNLALPYINQDLALTAVVSGWIPTSYMLSTAILQIPSARIADMWGRKKVFIAGVIVLSVFSILSGLATTGYSLIIYRFLSGLGSAMMFSTSTAILTSTIPLQSRGKALGAISATVYFSLAIGPLVGGVLTQHLSWQYIFFVAATISIGVAVAGVRIIKDDWKEKEKTRFDWVGSVLSASSLTLLIVGFSKLPTTIGILSIGLGVLALFLFAYYEKHQTWPVFNIREFLANRVFRLSSLAALINYSATFAISFMLSLYLQYVRGLSPQDAGFILISQSVIQAMASLKSGSLSDKMSPSTLATLGMSIIALGLLGLCFLTESTPYYLLVILLVCLGLGFGLFSSPNTHIIMSSVDKKHYSLASATMGTMRLTGQAFSMGIAIMTISLFVGSRNFSYQLRNELITSMQATFIICLVLCLFGIYASSVRGKRLS